ncbi:hypothetical protein ACXZ1K_13965 [Pedobacter sp. PWIIR3]
MDVSDEALIKFWASLNSHNVKYIMVGGFATRFHGFNRNTDDLDIWLYDTLENRRNFRAAFKQLGYGDFATFETMEFVPGWTSFHIDQGIELDIMTTMKGLENLSFLDCLELASIANLEGVEVPFLHINQLIMNKKAVDRPKDQIDVLELERIRALRNKNI